MSAAVGEAAGPTTTGSPSPETVLSTFLSHLKKPATLLVAISGGSDSTGLLLMLADVLRASQGGHRLVAATVDHRLRHASTSEAQWVADLCTRLDIPHQTLAWTADKPSTGIPAAAREARYRLLAKAADRVGAEMILTGHTLDDQIETVRMRAERRPDDASPGLAGMAPATLYDRRLWIVRPLLTTKREAIRSYLRRHGETWIDDPSNQDTRYERIRIRHAPIQFDEASIASAAAMRRTLSDVAAQWLDDRAERLGDYVLRIRLQTSPSTHAIDLPGARHALSMLAAIIGGKTHRPQAGSIDRLVEALRAGSDFRLTLAGSLFVRRRDELFCVRERRGLLPLPLPACASVIWDGRYRLDNPGPTDLHIQPGQAPLIDPALPGAVRTALSGNHPVIVGFQDNQGPAASAVRQDLHLPLLDHMLPNFDLSVARALDRLVGRSETPFCPI